MTARQRDHVDFEGSPLPTRIPPAIRVLAKRDVSFVSIRLVKSIGS